MTQAQIYIYGIDLGKNWFHLVVMDRMGHVLTKQKLTRSQLKQFIDWPLEDPDTSPLLT